MEEKSNKNKKKQNNNNSTLPKKLKKTTVSINNRKLKRVSHSSNNFDLTVSVLKKFINGEDYVFSFPKLSKISVDLLKKPSNYDFGNFFETKFEQIGKVKGIYIFNREGDNDDTLVKISKYNENENDMFYSKMNDMKVCYLLTDVFLKNVKQNFLLTPIMNFDCTEDDLNDYVKSKILENTAVDSSSKSSEPSELSKICVQIYENFDNLISLKTYISKNKNNLFKSDKFGKNLLFQVIYILSKILERYPNFHYGGLSIDSFFVKEKKIKSIDKFVLDDSKFTLKDCDFTLKITNFYNSKINRNKDDKSEKVKCDACSFFDDENIKEYLSPLQDEIVNNNEDDLNNIGCLENDCIYKNPLLILKKNNFFSDFISSESMNNDHSKSERGLYDSLTDEEKSYDNRRFVAKNKIIGKKVGGKTISGHRKFNNKSNMSDFNNKSNVSNFNNENEREIYGNNKGVTKKDLFESLGDFKTNGENSFGNKVSDNFSGLAPEWMIRQNQNQNKNNSNLSDQQDGSMGTMSGIPGMQGMPGMQGTDMSGMQGMPGMQQGMQGMDMSGMQGMDMSGMQGMPGMSPSQGHMSHNIMGGLMPGNAPGQEMSMNNFSQEFGYNGKSNDKLNLPTLDENLKNMNANFSGKMQLPVVNGDMMGNSSERNMEGGKGKKDFFFLRGVGQK